MLRLIGLCGPDMMANAKVADVLIEAGFEASSVALPMAQALATLTKTEVGHFLDPDLLRRTQSFFGGKSPADLMRELGDWARSSIAPDVLVKPVEDEIQQLLSGSASVVVVDVRLEEEAAMIRANGGRIWRVDSAVIRWRGGHRTESGIDAHPDDRTIHVDNDVDAEGIRDLLRRENSEDMVTGVEVNSTLGW